MSIADLISTALNAAAASPVGDAVQDVEIIRTTGRVLDPVTDTYSGGSAQTITGRAIFETDSRKRDQFPEGTGGGHEYPVWLFGMTGKPEDDEPIKIGGKPFVIVSKPREVMNLGMTMLAALVRDA